jgi:hypothetical protein
MVAKDPLTLPGGERQISLLVTKRLDRNISIWASELHYLSRGVSVRTETEITKNFGQASLLMAYSPGWGKRTLGSSEQWSLALPLP